MATRTPEMRLPSDRPGTADARPFVGWTHLLAVGGGTVLASTIANVLIARALVGLLQVPSVFSPLRASSVASLTIVGVIGAVLVFALLARGRRNPVPAFRLVAAIGLVVSWVPDVVVWAAHVFPGTTPPAILTLMSLHVVAAGLSVLLLGQFGVGSSSRR